MTNFISGFGYNFKGLGYLTSHRELWKFVVIPFLISIVIFAGLVSFYFGYFSQILAFLQRPFVALDVTDPQGFLSYVLDGVLWFVRQLLTVVVFAVSSVFMAVLGYFIVNIVSAPFYEAMADKIMGLHGRVQTGNVAVTGLVKKWIHAIKFELVKIASYIVITVIFGLLSLIPVVGMLFSILGLVISSWYFAFGLTAYPMVERVTPLSQMFLWGRQNKMRLVGFGIPALIPFLGLFILQIQVVGGTLLYIDNSK